MNVPIIDMGSNSIRLCVYQVKQDNTFSLLLSKKEMAGLAGYVTDGMLSKEGEERAIATLLHFKDFLRQFDFNKPKVFATASLRNISNSEQVVHNIKLATGYTVDLVSGERESSLAYNGALKSGDIDNGFVFDIGGGSTEIATVKHGKLLRGQSLPIGSLYLYRLFVSELWPTDNELKKIKKHTRSMLSLAHVEKLEGPVSVCGVGGSARAVMKVANQLFNLPEHNKVLTPKQLKETTKTLLRRDTEARNLIIKACPDRLHTILPGLVLVHETCKMLNADKITVTPYGAREGYLTELLDKGLI